MRQKHSYQPPASELSGIKTLVHPESVSDGHSKTQVLPSPPWSRSKPIQYLQFNRPGPGQNYKVPNKPGEDSPVPNPEPSTVVQRRPEVNSAVKGPPYPSMPDRQKEQQGQARMYYQKYYQSHRSEIKRRMQVWHKKWKNTTNYKLDQERRREHPDKFTRKPGGGYKVNKDRAQDTRDKKALMIPSTYFARLVYLPTKQIGTLLGIDPDTASVLIHLNDHNPMVFSWKTFTEDFVFLSMDDIESAMRDMDMAFEWQEDQESVDRIAGRYADFLYEKRPPDMEPGQYWTRGMPPLKTPHKITPNGVPDYYVWDNPGSAKVIPEDSDLVNNKAAIKLAAYISDIEQGNDPAINAKSKSIPVKLARVDEKNATWHFKATGSRGKIYKVKIKVLPKGNVRDIEKTNILASCSCPFWQWQGPEFHAQQEGYLLGKPRGTAERPDVKDPHGNHKACKHVIAALEKVKGFILPTRLPVSKKMSSLQYLSDQVRVGHIRYVSFEEIAVDSQDYRYGSINTEEGDF